MLRVRVEVRVANGAAEWSRRSGVMEHSMRRGKDRRILGLDFDKSPPGRLNQSLKYWELWYGNAGGECVSCDPQKRRGGLGKSILFSQSFWEFFQLNNRDILVSIVVISLL